MIRPLHLLLFAIFLGLAAAFDCGGPGPWLTGTFLAIAGYLVYLISKDRPK
jgi:hypothetical protein